MKTKRNIKSTKSQVQERDIDIQNRIMANKDEEYTIEKYENMHK